MYLKSVEMQGFKSFADKIYLDFNPGITGIVGPNGSGKSNISDAIRWVMGEQSVKSLRGSRMEDVIFSGTEVRKPQGFAEVSLTLDNSEHIFAVDYEEIIVTRRVYRSGEGEYFINHNACRLKDIHELFMDTGLGREGYSIVGQGKIDEILSNKSEDRRHIFEEAAGITKYKYRKNEAEKKLEKTNENLTRVTDIMRELRCQIDPLKNQSEKAKKYLRLREKLKNIEVSTAVVLIDKLKNDLTETERDYNIISESITTTQSEVETSEKCVNELYARLAEYDEESQLHRETQKNTSERATEENKQISLLTANAGYCNENIDRIKHETEKDKESMKQLDCRIKDYQSAALKIEKEYSIILQKKSVLENETKKQNLCFEDNSRDVEDLKTLIIDKTSEIASLQGKIVNCNILVRNFEAEYQNSENELKKQSGSYENLVVENDKIKKAYWEKKNELDNAKADLLRIEKQQKDVVDSEKSLAEKQNFLLSEFSKKVSKKNVLEDMESDFEGYNRSVKSVMAANARGTLKNATIYGPLSNLVTTEKKYVTAIEVAMMSVNQNIVTQTEQDAKAAIEYLKHNKLGRATFMPVSTIKGRNVDVSTASKQKGYIAVAKDLVKNDKLYNNIVSNVLGATVIADNIDNAVQMASKCGHRFRIVTLEGDVIQAGGAMSGGSISRHSGFLSRKAEIETLTDEIEALKAELTKVESVKKKNSQVLTSITETAETARQTLMTVNEGYVALKASAEHSKKYLDDADERKAALARDIKTIESRTKEIKDDIGRYKGDIKILETEITDLREKTDGKQLETDKILKNLQELQQKMLDLTIEENAKVKDLDLQKERLVSVNLNKNQLLTDLKEKNNQINGFTRRIEEIKADIESRRSVLDSLRNTTQSTDIRIEELVHIRKNTDLEVRKLQKKVNGMRERLFGLGQQKVKIEDKKVKIEQELEDIYTHIWEEYGLTYSDAVNICGDKEINLADAKREVAELKSQIKALGHINMDSIEEYKNVSERFEFLTAQTSDLEKAKGEFERIIDDMIRVMRKQFAEQFEVISRNFNKVFRELFGGGRAMLSLSDPNDILESGVEITAQPPGKKLQSLTLLSGGERAFTAIALLFAILQVRATPFCILDEIEAALDDVNVYRFADYLKQYSKKTQFIVVTHRRGTMESANVLYGVTMQEKGVSKLLSLNIDEVTE